MILTLNPGHGSLVPPFRKMKELEMVLWVLPLGRWRRLRWFCGSSLPGKWRRLEIVFTFKPGDGSLPPPFRKVVELEMVVTR